MYVVFDSSAGGTCYVYKDGACTAVHASSLRAATTLSFLEKTVREAGGELSAIEGLGVVMAQGSFTGTRVAVTIANTLALAFGVRVEAWHIVPTVERVERRYLDNTPINTPYLRADYSGNPRLHGHTV